MDDSAPREIARARPGTNGDTDGKSLDEACEHLDDEYGRVRRHFEHIHEALDEAEKAGPEDDLEGLLDKLEDAVQKARTGGVLGHGANGHARARKEYLEIKNG